MVLVVDNNRFISKHLLYIFYPTIASVICPSLDISRFKLLSGTGWMKPHSGPYISSCHYPMERSCILSYA